MREAGAGTADRTGQVGFSMVEMLMAAFILAIGLLGLAMLQAMAIRSASSGKNLTTAVRIAERVMDQVEMEGRLSWLNITDSSYTSPASLAQLRFIGQGTVYLGYDVDGAATTSAPVSSKPSAFFVVTESESAVSTASTGSLSDYTVKVEFTEAVDASGTLVNRNVTLVRRVSHG